MALKGANLILSSNLFILLSILSSHAETDKLLLGHQLKDGEYLVSPGKVFVLGFFTPISKEKLNGDHYLSPEILRHNRYLGMWYKATGGEKPVWVANRDSPIPDTSGSLLIGGDGRLEILQGGESFLLLSSKLASNQTSMVLMDTGNLVLSELGLNGSEGRILWQSFDYPTDTLLPGMRLGFSLKTRHKWEITSWVSDEVPARGTFTLGTDPNETNHQLIIWKRGEVYWKSGNWEDSGQFKNLHDSAYGFEYRSDTFKRFFILLLSAAVRVKPISFPQLMINEWGVLCISVPSRNKESSFSILHKWYNSYPSRTEESSFSMSPLVYCRPRLLDRGCVGFKLPECRTKVDSGSVSGYMVYECLKYSGNLTLSFVDCEALCLRNCSCVAYASLYQNGTGCELCSGIEAKNISDTNDYGKFHVLVYPLFEVPPDRSLSRLWIIIGSSIFLSVLFLAYICYSMWRKLKVEIIARQCYSMWRKLKIEIILFDFLQRKIRAIGRGITPDRTSFVELGTTTSYSAIRRKRKLKILYYKSHGLQLFTFQNISQATDDFSPSNKLGQGGFGTVYKGKLEGGQEVAVKRLSSSSKQGLIEFRNELKVISKLQHTNLVTIIGCCVERGEKIVVYEYMPNKSLDFFLFESNRKMFLDWKKRFNIIEGIAQGLLYLHKYSKLKIIHRDLKAANILLDQELNAKISDFGMARIFGRDESQAKTKRIVGTPGYMPPEYWIGGKYSAKSDVFSFGVLLIEIISGKKNYASYHPDRPLNLIGQAWELWKENRGLELIDETLAGGLCDKEQAMRCLHVGLLCAQEQPSDRPSISEVVTMISNGSTRLDPPNRPGFLVRDNLLMNIEELEQEDSLNVASISEEVGR